MRVKGIACPSCGEVIWSRHRHDFRVCGCGESFVDGGREYLRYGGSRLTEITIEELEVPDGMPRTPWRSPRSDGS